MKWFIKCLRHYADFSGRARRREYWMFVLFNAIFIFVWAFLITFLATGHSYYDEGAFSMILQLSWFGLFGLPGMAVAVRRLHDLGKSGWTILVGLIPVIGQIWMIVLMCTNGQTEVNRFGSDPKTSVEKFSDKAKLTSAGIVIIVASVLTLISLVIRHFFPAVYFNTNFDPTPLSKALTGIIPQVLILAAGILLVCSIKREQTQPALWIVLTVFTFFSISGLITESRFFMENTLHFSASYYLYLVCNRLFRIALAIMAAMLLFAPQNRSAVRGGAITVMALAGLTLLLWYYQTVSSVDLSRLSDIFNLLGTLGIISWILFAWTFMSKNVTTRIFGDNYNQTTETRNSEELVDYGKEI